MIILYICSSRALYHTGRQFVLIRPFAHVKTGNTGPQIRVGENTKAYKPAVAVVYFPQFSFLIFLFLLFLSSSSSSSSSPSS